MRNIYILLCLILILNGCSLWPFGPKTEREIMIARDSRPLENRYGEALKEGSVKTLLKYGKLKDVQFMVSTYLGSFGYVLATPRIEREGFKLFEKGFNVDPDKWAPRDIRRIIVKFTDLGDGKINIELVNDSIRLNFKETDKDIGLVTELMDTD